MECPIYDNIRRNLFLTLRIYGEIYLNIILDGNTELSVDQKIECFHTVQKIEIDLVNHAGLKSLFTQLT